MIPMTRLQRVSQVAARAFFHSFHARRSVWLCYTVCSVAVFQDNAPLHCRKKDLAAFISRPLHWYRDIPNPCNRGNEM